ncbi:MAG: hypothetical protein ACLFR0_08595 [Alphaproteobacteria bacterium]
MGTKARKEPVIHIERGAPDRILPKHFAKIFFRRFLPVLALTYISTVLGMAFKKGNPEKYLLQDSTVYTNALFAPLWVSIPALLWIVLRGSHLFNHVANIWYWISAVIMMVTLFMSYFLFPEAELYGLRMYIVPTIPMSCVMYYFLVRHPLPSGIAHMLSAMGITAILFGVWIRFM